MHKKWFILPVGLIVLAGCTPADRTPIDETSKSANEQNTSSETSEQKEEKTDTLTKEEIAHLELLESLPEDANSKDWNLILVNNWKPLPDDFEPNLVEVEPDKEIDARIVEPFEEWISAGLEADHRLFFASGYRSVERQQNNYDNSISKFKQEGYTEEEAIAKTEEYIAIPKRSEHHTGLAVDIVDQQWIADGNSLTPDYDTQESQHWLLETMTDYGFILRYPEGAEALTDINYESWHFRYVGKENAQFIEEHELVLEEFIELLEERENL
ncbi:M15 family metallopeptidase [Marinilactibacillus sp. XAAS-LB27]|uniref:M15 family metallopeptidase n=1 Tax=Marinilactibacillus sp. XAAS-LB27 TaxID=3114538 RepID=UPI002E180740|nr:M15 family metallopeptidase [Marinilactibacillus sp. XAAS-LB27]